MLTKNQAEAIAKSAHSLRPEWTIQQVMAVLGDPRIRTQRSYQATAIAIAAIATDDESRQPTRLLNSGPWWTTANPMAPVYNFPIPDEACTECGQPPHRHTAPAFADHQWANRPPTPATKELPNDPPH